MHTFSPTSPITNDAVISLIVNNSSAAFAHIIPAFLSSSLYIDIPIFPCTIFASFTI